MFQPEGSSSGSGCKYRYGIIYLHAYIKIKKTFIRYLSTKYLNSWYYLFDIIIIIVIINGFLQNRYDKPQWWAVPSFQQRMYSFQSFFTNRSLPYQNPTRTCTTCLCRTKVAKINRFSIPHMDQMPVTTLTIIFNSKFLDTRFTEHFILLPKLLNFFMCWFFRSLW